MTDRNRSTTRALQHQERQVVGPGRIALRSVRSAPRRAAVRHLEVDGARLIDTGIDCDTCFLTLSGGGSTSEAVLRGLHDRLAEGLDHLDPVVLDVVEAVLPAGAHSALLLEIEPRGPTPLFSRDPRDPQTEEYMVESPVLGYGTGSPFQAPWRRHDLAYEDLYARGLATTPPFTTPVAVREAVVPLVDLGQLDPGTVQTYRDELAGGSPCTAVAWSVLESAADDEVALVHYLLDGHHKMHAAASGGHPIRLLSLLSHTAGMRPAAEARLVAQALARA